jgi:mRNA interferase MazF
MSDPAPSRGDLWLDKLRPLVILTRDPMGRLLHAGIAAPVTSRVRGLSTEVPVGPEDGVRIESVVSLDNVQLVARGRLVRRVGRARPATMHAICAVLSVAVGCDY